VAVVSMMRFSGDPKTLAAAAAEHVDPVTRRLGPKYGMLGSIVARTGDGILVINLWEAEEGRHAMAVEPEVQEAVRDAGFPMPEFEGYEVLELRVGEEWAAT
jgi:hypothetical protein